MDIERFEQESAEVELIELLVEQEELEGAALGIAKQILGKGMDSLSEKQLAVYNSAITPRLSMDCSRCGTPMTATETADAMRECDEYCGWCRHMAGKMNEDD